MRKILLLLFLSVTVFAIVPTDSTRDIGFFGQSNAKSDVRGGGTIPALDTSYKYIYLTDEFRKLTDNWQDTGTNALLSSFITPTVNMVLFNWSYQYPLCVSGYAGGGIPMIGANGFSYRNPADHDDGTTPYGLLLRNLLKRKPVPLVMFQGESDKSQTKANYKKAFDSLNAHLIEDLGYTPKIFIVQINDMLDTLNARRDYYNIMQAHRELDDSTNTFLVATTYDLPLTADGHVNTTGQATLGKRIGNVISKYFDGTLAAGNYRGPRIDTAFGAVSRRGEFRVVCSMGSSDSLLDVTKGKFKIKNSVSTNTFIHSVARSGDTIIFQTSDRAMNLPCSLSYGLDIDDIDPTHDVIYGNDSVPLEPEDWMPFFVDAVDPAKDFFWLGSTSSNPTNSLNWANTSGGTADHGIPDTGTVKGDVFFDGGGNNAFKAVGAHTWASWTVDSTFTAACTTDYKISVGGGNIQLKFGGIFRNTGEIEKTGDGNIVILNKGTFSTSAMNVDHQGTGQITINKGIVIDTLQCAYTGKTTTINGSATALNLNNSTSYGMTWGGGTFTSTQQINHTVTASVTPISWNNSTVSISGYTILAGANNITITIPAMTIGGTGEFGCYGEGGSVRTGVIYNQTGNISVPYLTFSSRGLAGTKLKYRTNGFNISTTSAAAGVLFDNLASGCSDSVWLYGSTINTVFFRIDASAPGTVVYGDSSNITASGIVTFGAGSLFYPGKSTLTITGTCTYTGRHNWIRNLTVNNTGTGYFTVADSLRDSGNVTLTDGKFNLAKKHLVIVGDLNIATTDTIKIDSAKINIGGDLIVTNGKIRIGDTVYCNDAVINTTDSVIISGAGALIVSGNFSCAGAVKFNTGAKIVMTTCTQATLNGNAVVVTYPVGCSFTGGSRRRPGSSLNVGLMIGVGD